MNHFAEKIDALCGVLLDGSIGYFDRIFYAEAKPEMTSYFEAHWAEIDNCRGQVSLASILRFPRALNKGDAGASVIMRNVKLSGHVAYILKAK